MRRIALSGRNLVLVAGMPGAGKSTLLAGLAPVQGMVVLDSEASRRTLRRVAPGVPYAWYRPLVHLLHRSEIVAAVLGATPIVVVHLPATDEHTRTVLARLAAMTGRRAHLVWLHAEPEQARQGQRARGRVIPARSFGRHAGQAVETSAALRDGTAPRGFASVTVLDRAAARRGLRIVPDPAPATAAAS